MKPLVVFMLIFFVCAAALNAQVPPDSAYTNRPVFEIMKPDSTLFNNRHLPPDTPVVIIYFSPDCGHCQIEAEAIAKAADSLRNAFFVWVSYHDPEAIEKFSLTYHLKQQPNMVFGRDVQYRLPVLFKVKSTPYTVIFDRNKRFVKDFRMGVSVEKLKMILVSL